MKVDMLIVRNGWWPKAWGIIFKGKDRATVIIESPFNPHARGGETETVVEGEVLKIYENQIIETWTLEEVLGFVQALDSIAEEDEVELVIAEELAELLENVRLQRVRWWTTGYAIYM